MKAISAPVDELPDDDQAGADAEHDGIGDRRQELDEGEVQSPPAAAPPPGSRGSRARAGGIAPIARSSWTKACDSRTPDRLSWKSALTMAIRSRDRS